MSGFLLSLASLIVFFKAILQLLFPASKDIPRRIFDTNGKIAGEIAKMSLEISQAMSLCISESKADSVSWHFWPTDIKCVAFKGFRTVLLKESFIKVYPLVETLCQLPCR